jgi:5-methylcytosine-specific restriction endonuclease McrA
MRKSPTKIKPGDRFGRLVARSHHHMLKSKRYLIFDCDCGSSKIIAAHGVVQGQTKSCGCLMRESRSKRRTPGDGVHVNKVLRQYQKSAKMRKIEWQLRRDEFEALIRGKCIYCGDLHGNLTFYKRRQEGFAYNGIDRLDPSKPYHIENCASCCGTCNLAKRSMTHDQFTSWIKKCAKNLKSKAAIQSSAFAPTPQATVNCAPITESLFAWSASNTKNKSENALQRNCLALSVAEK